MKKVSIKKYHDLLRLQTTVVIYNKLHGNKIQGYFISLPKSFLEDVNDIKPGFINAALPWYSSSDLSRVFGKSRQWWEKEIKHGKLDARKTAAGSIVTTEDLAKYYGFV